MIEDYPRAAKREREREPVKKWSSQCYKTAKHIIQHVINLVLSRDFSSSTKLIKDCHSHAKRSDSVAK